MDVSGVGKVDGVIGEDELSRYKRTSKKCECGAMIYASMNQEGLWVLRKVFLDHVHKVSPTESKLVKEYRMKKLTTNVRKNLIHFYDEGTPVTQIHGCLGLDKTEEILPTVKDLQHEIYKERRTRLNMAGGDCAAMMEYFEKMQADNSNFYHTHRQDEDARMKDVMWVDARSMATFEYFGDVCMDATYLTNEYELPFVNVVGVNHHGPLILLGCALVSHEDTDTYCWFIRQWLACMSNNPPKSILTDQAAAIRKAISLKMPTARLRWCIWHIMRKIPEKLGKCDGYMDFKSPLKKVIYESFTKEEFESRWISLVNEHKLEANDWLSDLYEERHMWVPAFMKEHFWVGMKTTQRVESINSFFDGFVNRNTKLHEFPLKYNRAMTKRVRDENNADARCSKYERRLVSGFKLEKIYTNTKFQEIQKECAHMMYVYPREERILQDNLV
ncbi:protein FAR-RED IMPAIRED RESPONSE 1-like [Chenopodium quinoa]|nr:protein FAR-RED IMPAIRED RESPONSE 1-like [Chenopodium quinoa]